MKPRCLEDTVYFAENVNSALSASHCPPHALTSHLLLGLPPPRGAAGGPPHGPDSLEETAREQPGVSAPLFYIKELWLFLHLTLWHFTLS